MILLASITISTAAHDDFSLVSMEPQVWLECLFTFHNHLWGLTKLSTSFGWKQEPNSALGYSEVKLD